MRCCVSSLALTVLAVLSTGSITIAANVQMIGPGFATDVSADGSVVVGNTAAEYETFRWTQSTGVVPLGRATVPIIFTGAGAPKVSANGQYISATIIDDTNTYGTQGRWSQGSGWQQLMPPPPPDGGILDNYYGSAFGISGDGGTVLGLYWRPGQPGGLAHASAWTQATGVVDLGSSGNSSRVEAANYNGSVIVGWDEHPSFGNRRPAVWEGGVMTVLDAADGPGEVHASNAIGDVIAGDSYNYVDNFVNATRWTKTAGSWVPQMLGVLPGTDTLFGGFSSTSDMSADGSIMVGYNNFGFFGGSTGFVWTAESGMVAAADWLSSVGAAMDPNFHIDDLSAVSADGTTVVGYGYDMITFEQSSFIVTIPEPGFAGVLVLAALVGNRTLGRTGRQGRVAAGRRTV